MNILQSVTLGMALILLPWTGAVAQEAPPDGAKSTPYAGEAFDKLFESLTFRVTFDRESMMPDMAAGEKSKPTVRGAHDKSTKTPAFEDGLVGKALVLGTGYGLYPRKGNVLLEKQGSIALWVKPLEFKRPNDGNVVFVRTSGGNFYLQRQGPKVLDGKKVRNEGVQFLAKASKDQKIYTSLSAGVFKNDTWYLLVANWQWPKMALSVNGQPFVMKTLPQDPEQGLFGSLIVGAGGGSKALLDEVMAFNRPLTVEEAKLLYTIRTRLLPDGDTARPQSME